MLRRIPTGQIAISGNNLTITGLSLSGTHIVAGDSSSGSDPTVIHLENLSAFNTSDFNPGVFLCFLASSIAGMYLLKRFRTRLN